MGYVEYGDHRSIGRLSDSLSATSPPVTSSCATHQTPERSRRLQKTEAACRPTAKGCRRRPVRFHLPVLET